jgi:hypothetical protein
VQHERGPKHATAELFALFGFLVGAMIGGTLIGRLGHDRAQLLGVGAGLELVLVIAACVIAAVGSTPFTSTVRNVIAALLAIGMGIQNAVARRLAVPDLTTTVLTMTLTGIAADVRSGTNRTVFLRRLASVAAMRGAERKARRAGDREAGKHDVARHVGHEDPPQLQNADGIYQASHHRERQQEWRQRTVTRIASGQLPYPGPGVTINVHERQ